MRTTQKNLFNVIFCLFCAIVFCSCENSKVKTLLDPECDSISDNKLSVDKVIITDSMTIVDFSYQFEEPNLQTYWNKEYLHDTRTCRADSLEKFYFLFNIWTNSFWYKKRRFLWEWRPFRMEYKKHPFGFFWINLQIWRIRKK